MFHLLVVPRSYTKHIDHIHPPLPLSNPSDAPHLIFSQINALCFFVIVTNNSLNAVNAGCMCLVVWPSTGVSICHLPMTSYQHISPPQGVGAWGNVVHTQQQGPTTHVR